MFWLLELGGLRKLDKNIFVKSLKRMKVVFVYVVEDFGQDRVGCVAGI